MNNRTFTKTTQLTSALPVVSYIFPLGAQWRRAVRVFRFSPQKTKKRCDTDLSNMAPSRRVKRVAASQPGFMPLNASIKPENLVSNRRKRINKNKKKNWNKHIDVNDVEDFLEDVRLQERTTG